MNFMLSKSLLLRICFAYSTLNKIKSSNLLPSAVCRAEVSPACSQTRAGNGFDASIHCASLEDSGEFVMSFNASPLPNVLPTFKKLLKVRTPEANCFVIGDNTRSRKGSVSFLQCFVAG